MQGRSRDAIDRVRSSADIANTDAINRAPTLVFFCDVLLQGR